MSKQNAASQHDSLHQGNGKTKLCPIHRIATKSSLQNNNQGENPPLSQLRSSSKLPADEKFLQAPEQTFEPAASEDGGGIHEREEEEVIEEYMETLSNLSGSYSNLEKYRNFQIVLEMICVASMDPVIISDEKGIIKTVNEEFLKLFGYRRWEIIGKNVKIIMPEKFAKVHDKYMQRYHKSKMKRIIGEKRDNIKAVRKDGSEFPIVLKVSELSSGSEIAFIGMIKNVTYDQELLRIKHMLSNMLPETISNKIQSGEKEIAQEVEGTVVFIDLVGFTTYMSVTPAKQVVQDLNFIFKHFDTFCAKYKVEKIKTIGDAYMAVCNNGVDGNVFDHAIRVLELCMDVLKFMGQQTQFHVRIGVATGPLIEGVLSGAKLSFDVWGDTVNVASRLQNLADTDGVIVCPRTYAESNFKYDYKPMKQMEVKGKGMIETYTLLGKKK